MALFIIDFVFDDVMPVLLSHLYLHNDVNGVFSLSRAACSSGRGNNSSATTALKYYANISSLFVSIFLNDILVGYILTVLVSGLNERNEGDKIIFCIRVRVVVVRSMTSRQQLKSRTELGLRWIQVH